MAIIQPTGEVKLIRYCFPIREHTRSAHFRDLGDINIPVSEAEVDAHTRCLVAGADEGLGKLIKGWSVAGFDTTPGSKKNAYLGRIYFRTQEEAEEFVKIMRSVVKPTASIGFRVNDLKQPIAESLADSPDFNGKVLDGIGQLRRNTENMIVEDAARSIERRFQADATVVKEIKDSLRKGQENAEDVARQIGKAFNELNKRIENLEESNREMKKLMEELSRSMEKIARGKPSDVVNEIAKNAKRLADLTAKVEREKANIETLKRRLKSAKDKEEIEGIKKNIKLAQARLREAERKAKLVGEVVKETTELARKTRKIT
ncbi:MAG: hypothetical protein ACK421_07660 [Pseudanabaenaceae cyanobacterium]